MAYDGTGGNITYDASGYVGWAPQVDYGTNPWQVDDVTGQMQAGTQNLQNMGAAAQNYSNASSPYPTLPNSAGLGSQNAFQPPQSSNVGAPSLQANPQTGGSPLYTPPDAGSRGFNPWSLQGEAMSR